ncbi:hypothetical protein BYT27DRAFT_6430750 [Phlegmacium glaucopus]|nr:hypothetical protein BYT27DRAFT_6430750 [Phlegmacium glaucopus]
MAESSPLLDDSNGDLDDNFEAQTNVPIGSHFKRLIQNLIIISLILSALTFILLIANYVIIKRVAPFTSGDYIYQRAEHSSKELAKFVFLLHDTFPDSYWCRIQIGYPNPGENLPHPKCNDWKSAVTILMGIAASFGGIVGLIHVALLVLRSVAILRTKFWKRPLASIFSTGQISLKISMNILSRESATTGNTQDVGQGAEAGGRGPLYLS